MMRVLAWCFLASVSIASIEAIGYFSTQGADPSLPFSAFFGLFSNTCGIMLIATVAAWLLIWFFMVWLGGVRSGLALFFILVFFMLFDGLVVVLDVPLSYAAHDASCWPVMMKFFACFALFLAVLGSLILGKISRSVRPINPTPRAFVLSAALFMGTAMAVWARNICLPHMQCTVFWGTAAAAATVSGLVLRRFGGTPRRLDALLVALAVVVFAPLPTALSNRPSSQVPAKKDSTPDHPVKHVILITIDTLRQDSLGPYNANAASSPHIDQFARDSAVFTNAFSGAPWTCPSVTTILTGLAPRIHQLGDGRNVLPKEIPTMAGAMENAGYRTGACGLNSVLLPGSQLDRGFQEYRWFPENRFVVKNFEVGLAHNLLDLCGSRKPDAAQLTDQTIEWVKGHAQQDFFFWVHYYDLHTPYTPPKEFQPTDPAQRKMGRSFTANKAVRMGTAARTAGERNWVRALYDGEVRYVDAQVGRLLDSLRELGIYDDTLIVLTSDHGEEFWDHDRFEHGHTLYNELIRVPLLVKLPGGHTGATIDTGVSLQAIMPTVLDLCGVAPDARGILLPPLSPLLRDRRAAYTEQPVFSGACLFYGHMESVIFGGMKYVREALSGHEMLFNLKEDPEERCSLAGQDPLNLEKGRQLLNDAQAADSRLTEQLGIREEGKDCLSQEEMRSLQALGYL